MVSSGFVLCSHSLCWVGGAVGGRGRTLDCTRGGQGRMCRQAMRGPTWRMGAGQEWGFVRAGNVGRHGAMGEEGDRGQARSRCRVLREELGTRHVESSEQGPVCSACTGNTRGWSLAWEAPGVSTAGSGDGEKAAEHRRGGSGNRPTAGTGTTGQATGKGPVSILPLQNRAQGQGSQEHTERQPHGQHPRHTGANTQRTRAVCGQTDRQQARVESSLVGRDHPDTETTLDAG